MSQRLTERALCPPEDLCAQLGTSEQGLGDSEARARLQEHGPDDGEQDHPPAWWHHLWVSYRNPFNLLLTVLAAMSLLTGDVQGALVIAFVIVLASLIHFFHVGCFNQGTQ